MQPPTAQRSSLVPISRRSWVATIAYLRACGYALAGADFGRSTHADLAIGLPYDDPDDTNAGSTLVLYGSSQGLIAADLQFWTQDSCVGLTCIRGDTESADNFGKALAAVNFGKSSHADLAIGVPEENWEQSGLNVPNNIGGINVIYGSTTGLTPTGNQFWWQRSSSLTDSGDGWERFGATLE